jgi:hypothetical protein
MMNTTDQTKIPRNPLQNKPFSPRSAEAPASHDFMQHIEHNAALIRQKADIPLEAKLDPFALVKQFGVLLVTLDALNGFSAEDREKIENIPVKKWSGGGMPLPQGDFLVILHPLQTPERAAVTMMEEIAHAHYRHKPNRFYCDDGVFRREFDPKIEQEAYWTAAATLLPSKVIGLCVMRGLSSEEIAAEFGVSKELVEFRIKTRRLWKDYQKQQAKRKEA